MSVDGMSPSMNTVPNKPKTTIRGVRVPDELWLPFKAKATAEGTDASSKIRDFIERDLADSEVVERQTPKMTEEELRRVWAHIRKTVEHEMRRE